MIGLPHSCRSELNDVTLVAEKGKGKSILDTDFVVVVVVIV